MNATMKAWCGANKLLHMTHTVNGSMAPIAAELQQGGRPSIEGISRAARAAKAAYLGPVLRTALAWMQPPERALVCSGGELRDACLCAPGSNVWWQGMRRTDRLSGCLSHG